MEDRRKTRSRQYLIDALLELMKKKSAHAVTVQELVTQAQVARSTFYALYESKEQFLSQIVDDMFAGLRRQVQPRPGEQAVPGQYYSRHFQYIARHAPFFLAMLGEHGVSDFRRKMEESALETYQKVFAPVAQEDLPLPKDCLIQYLISAHIGLTYQWLREGMRYSPAYMAGLLNQLTFQGIVRSLHLEDTIKLPL